MSNKNIPEQDDEWGNIELPNVPDKELYGYNWNYSKTKEDKARQKIAMQNRDNSSHAEAGKKRAADPEWKENHRKGLEALRNDPERWAEYQENYLKGNTAKYDDPAFWENYYAGIAKRDADVEYTKERLKKSKQKIRKPVRTPLGVFETQTDATKAHGFNNTEVIRHRCKSPNFPDFQSISVEEYEKEKLL